MLSARLEEVSACIEEAREKWETKCDKKEWGESHGDEEGGGMGGWESVTSCEEDPPEPLKVQMPVVFRLYLFFFWNKKFSSKKHQKLFNRRR